ncbi:DNA-binding transcriptional LysR family regulator [Angulomicrobium tetraedrale]|uniref:DNA-binding transcriptional LysR family regulator n=1 Tax=Ancylobacter tetraedralis TaxID=217068 RepID=A0A839ZB32_9HYPH|nr:LysR family transcriptional regulator [Ancylobacter tetraedralis]MBB3771961.1 DNA-binding transcriptional LysR family regulator [Ancylobacter tetraedralis]
MKPYEQRLPFTLDWNLLRTFMVVAEQGGITRAADFLGLRQPTLSSALKRLEDTVGHRLVDRGPSHFALTEAGRILYQESRAMFEAVAQIPGLMSVAEGRVSGHVNIAMTSHVVSPHLDTLLTRFNELHPDVTYAISVTESEEVLNRLRQNRMTFGLCLMNRPDPALTARVLFREFFGLFCGPGHRLFGREGIELSDLQGEDSVSFQTDVEGGSLHCVTQLREMALLKPKLKGVSANLPEVLRMIVAGIGIGALPVHVARRDVEAGLLWRLPPYTDLPAVDVFFVTNPQRSLNPAEHVLVQWIDDMLDTVPVGERSYPPDID